jgi:hypothetical protein
LRPAFLMRKSTQSTQPQVVMESCGQPGILMHALLGGLLGGFVVGFGRIIWYDGLHLGSILDLKTHVAACVPGAIEAVCPIRIRSGGGDPKLAVTTKDNGCGSRSATGGIRRRRRPSAPRLSSLAQRGAS